MEDLVISRNKGLCYHCDKKWILGHHCRPRLHLLIVDNDEECPDLPPPPLTTAPAANSDSPVFLNAPQISLNALSGMPTSETFRLYDTIAHHQVIILVDGGSIHNFIQARRTSFLQLAQVPARPCES